MDCSMPGSHIYFTVSQSLLKLMSIECIILSKHLILCCPLLLLPSSRYFPVSQLFALGSQSIGASASVLQSFQWIFRVGLLVVQGTLKNLLQHHNLKVSVLWHSAFFMIQLLYLYTTMRKSINTIALTIQTFVSKVISLLFNILSRCVLVFLLRTSILISWLQSLSAVIFEPLKRKSVTALTFSFYLSWSNRMPWPSFSECWVLS